MVRTFYLLCVLMLWLLLYWYSEKPVSDNKDDAVLVLIVPEEQFNEEETQPLDEEQPQEALAVPDEARAVKQQQSTAVAGTGGAATSWRLAANTANDEKALIRYLIARNTLLLNIATKQVFYFDGSQLLPMQIEPERLAEEYRAFSVNHAALSAVITTNMTQGQFWLLIPSSVASSIYPADFAGSATSLVVDYKAQGNEVTFTISDARHQSDVVSDLVGRQWSLK